MNNLHKIHKPTNFQAYAKKCEDCRRVLKYNPINQIELFEPKMPEYKGLHLRAKR